MTTATKVRSIYKLLIKDKVDKAGTIKGDCVIPDADDKKAQKALAKIKDKYDHQLVTYEGSEIFRLPDEKKLMVVFSCAECGQPTVCRTSDLFQRDKCGDCKADAARKSRAAKKQRVDSQLAKAEAEIRAGAKAPVKKAAAKKPAAKSRKKAPAKKAAAKRSRKKAAAKSKATK